MRAALCLIVLLFTSSAYRAQTQEPLSEIYIIRDLTLRRDVLTISFTRGAMAFLPPVNGRVTGAIFVGSGDIVAIPPDNTEKKQLFRHVQSPILTEQFETAVLRFTDNTHDEIMRAYNERAQEEASGEEREAIQAFEAEARQLATTVDHRVQADVLGLSDRPFFHAQFRSEARGRFNAVYDQRRVEEVALWNTVENPTADVIWTSFQRRSEVRDAKTQRAQETSPIDVLSYEIDATINREANVDAKAGVKLRSRTAGERVLSFALAPALRVTSVTSDTGTALPFQRNGSHFVVVWPDPLKADQEIALQVAYAGPAIQTLRNSSVGVNHADWYPRLDSPDRALFSMTFHFPATLNLVASGTRKAESAAGTLRHATWSSEHELLSAGFNVTSCLVYPDEAEAPHLYTCLGNDAELAKRMLDSTREVVKYFQRFGDFPFERLTVLPLPQLDARSSAGIVYVPIGPFLAPDQRTSEMDWQFAREIARQWFGHSLAVNHYRHEWIVEGLANYAAAMYVRSKYAEAEFREVLNRARTQLIDTSPEMESYDALGPASLGSRLGQFKTTPGYLNTLQNKSVWIAHMLRMQSPDTFDAMVLELRTRFGSGFVSTTDAKEIAEKHLGENLDWFFDQWVFETGVPTYRLEHSIEPGPGGFVITGRIVQSAVPETFSTRVPLYADETLLGNVTVSADDGAFRFTSPTRPEQVRIDPRGTVLAIIQ